MAPRCVSRHCSLFHLVDDDDDFDDDVKDDWGLTREFRARSKGVGIVEND